MGGLPNKGREPELDGFVRRLRLHSPLSATDAEAVRNLPHTLKILAQNRQIVWEGEGTTHCVIVVEGFVHRFRVTDLGLRQILALYLPGDPIDLEHLFLPVADDGLQVTRQSRLAYVRHDDLRTLMAERPAVAEAITRAMLVDSSIFREWTLNVGRRDARSRIAHLLCELSARLEARDFDFAAVPLPLTQEQIADATGLSSVHVNRILRTLGTEGLIRRKGALVMLPDVASLREVAGFDVRYLHLNR